MNTTIHFSCKTARFDIDLANLFFQEDRITVLRPILKAILSDQQENGEAIQRTRCFLADLFDNAQKQAQAAQQEFDAHRRWVACMGSVLEPPFISKEAKEQARAAKRKARWLLDLLKARKRDLIFATKAHNYFIEGVDNHVSK